MPIGQRIVSYGISAAAVATIAIAARLTPWVGTTAEETGVVEPTWIPRAADPRAARAAASDRAGRLIDLVFAVDTTASMGRLLDGARRTVWAIANHIRQSAPDADLHVGLVAYRDIGSDYVTRDFQLSNDLDAMYVELSSYRAEQGGDIPEDVAAGLYDAIYNMHWRDGAKKLIFLVGDAAPADRGDVPRYDVLAREAGERQIIVNTIRCGQDPNTAAAWGQIAALGHGEFSTVRQDGGVQELATPFDAKLAALSTEVDRSAVILGEGARARYDNKIAVAAAAPAHAKADRAGYYASMGSAARDENDAVAAVTAGTLSVDAVNGADLPAELRKLDKDQISAELARRAEARRAAQHQIDELAKQRDAYLKEKSKNSAGFDEMVEKAIDRELER
jgi:hypothetical protein